MERRAITICGIVQGVGFRPFVYRLAETFCLAGFVRNQTGGVFIEVEGEASSLSSFLKELCEQAPASARIEHLSCVERPPQGEEDFRIEPSEAVQDAAPLVAPDIVTCADCLRELFDPADRRFRYPFLNCTNCGPRLTIITGAPYDRPRTTMAGFSMCAECRAEYEDPSNRRFHAQPTGCARCGPRLQVRQRDGVLPVEAPFAHFVAALRGGRIGALKGLGGYHLVCDATQAKPVAELRRRKHRDEKPFAVVVANLAAAEALCEVTPCERHLLGSPAGPIVLLRKRSGTPIAEAVAPGNPCLGIMLPYAPLHHLLLHAVESPVVMTSGNRSDEPIAYEDEDALERLDGIADLFLVHDRPIHLRCDDSVTRVVAGQELPLRRSRGYAPYPIRLPQACSRAVLAVGGQLKATFALGRSNQAILSHHLGDLDHYDAYRAFERDVCLYEDLFAFRPECLAHDLHPDYASTHYALGRAAKIGIGLLGVQHHHAHLASCMAEHGLTEPVIGVIFDGTGFGLDGAVWGGEFLVGDCLSARRAAHFRYVGMPGGEQAIRDPWRMALAHCVDTGVECRPWTARFRPAALKTVRGMLETRFNTPQTSSVGRLFDAVASLAGVRDRVSYEGQAAVEMEHLASDHPAAGPYPFGLDERPDGAHLIVDTRPLIQAVCADASAPSAVAAYIARRFHSTLVEIIVAVCRRLRTVTGIEAIVLSGGVFLNALLTTKASAKLHADGFRVYRHRIVPPSDGGLSLGQLAVAAARLTAT